MVELYDFQKEELSATEHLNKVAYYHDMGLGKTFTGCEKLMSFNSKINLIICQKSKCKDWYDHVTTHYDIHVYDLSQKGEIEKFMTYDYPRVGIINYELTYRRPFIKKLDIESLLVDESSLIQNPKAERTKFIMSLNPKNVVLLSGTPTSGKYELLVSQLNLLGWKIPQKTFDSQYVVSHYIENELGFPVRIIDGYKNVDRLKKKMREYGCRFLKTEDVISLPSIVFERVKVPNTYLYTYFQNHGIVDVGNTKLVGETTLTQSLYERMLCGVYNQYKIDAVRDLLNSTEERFIIFYNWDSELECLSKLCEELERPYGMINGHDKDSTPYTDNDNGVLLIQYKSGAMGGNWQQGRRIIYFTPTWESDIYEQSKKRVHRIGQKETCFYYALVVEDSIEERVYEVLEERKDYTLELFENGRRKSI